MTDDVFFDDFSERKLHRNLGLDVDGRRFWVARDAMAEHSSVFMNMLYGDYQEKNKDVIPLIAKNAQEILELLRCLFTGKEVNDQNVDVLLKLGDEYDIQSLMKQCKKALIDQIRTTMEMTVGDGEEKIIKLFLTAVRYKMKEPVRNALPVVARFGLTKIQSFLGELATEVRCAVLAQMAGQSTEHDREKKNGKVCFFCKRLYNNGNDACSRCSFAICDTACCNEANQSHGALSLCVTCQTCRKPTIFDLLKDETPLSSGCQCINPLADEELKKIGL